MPNRAYADLTTLKSAAWLNYSSTAEDAYLRALLEVASEAIEKDLGGRRFQPYTATRYYDSKDGAAELWLDEDLLSVTTLKVDENGDATYERSWVSADYILWPYNSFPKRCIKADMRTTSNKYTFGYGNPREIEIAGLWGYGDGESATPYVTAASALAEELDASEVTVDVASGGAYAVGQTIIIDSEQMYVQSISTNTLTVVRGVNGTTAATHTNGATVYKYQYPQPIKQAVLIQAARWWKRKDSAFATLGGLTETGQLRIETGLDPDVKLLLNPFRIRKPVVV